MCQIWNLGGNKGHEITRGPLRDVQWENAEGDGGIRRII
jgi:hypothetical protein